MARPGFKTKMVRDYKSRPSLTERLQSMQNPEEIKAFIKAVSDVKKFPNVSQSTVTKLRKIAREKLIEVSTTYIYSLD